VSPAGTAAYDDATITTRVKTVLLNDPEVGALKIDVNTAQGVVTLSGTARNRGEEQKAIQLAKGVQGVKDVRSNLQVGG
jgi:hyperosmotically inducible protein